MMQKTGKREIMQIPAEEKRMVAAAFYSSRGGEPNVLFGSIEYGKNKSKPGYYTGDIHIPVRNLNLKKNGKLLELGVGI